MVFTVEPAQFAALASMGGGQLGVQARGDCDVRRSLRRVSRLARRATSTDHKRIGLNLGLLLARCSSCSAALFALLMRAQLAQPNGQLVSDNTYNELFTMHGSTMIYLFVTPMAMALAMYLVPLQIGARLDRGAAARRWPASGSGCPAGW